MLTILSRMYSRLRDLAGLPRDLNDRELTGVQDLVE
jgi:hypothetical protein